MTTVPRLFAEYIEEHRRIGDADPLPYLDRVAPAEREELAALIDAYLVRAPRREFDEASYRGSPSEEAVDELQRAIAGSSGLWPILLPRLRQREGLKRRELVERLATALGAGGRAEKVARYYHEMEHGLLPARGVSDRVLVALAELLGSSSTSLRKAGQTPAVETDWEAASGVAFARTVTVDARAYSAPASAPQDDELWDEIDALFRGGP
jgi:hypothetical protein